MKHMLLLYADTRQGAKIPADEMAKWMEKMRAYQASLEEAGVFVETAGLAPFWEATTVKLESGRLQVQAGPYMETPEQLGGYFIIDVADMAAAQHWAGQCPAAIWGHIEVRPFARSSAG